MSFSIGLGLYALPSNCTSIRLVYRIILIRASLISKLDGNERLLCFGSMPNRLNVDRGLRSTLRRLYACRPIDTRAAVQT